MQGYCGKVVIDAFDPGLLRSPYTCLPIDFNAADEEDLQVCSCPCQVHRWSFHTLCTYLPRHTFLLIRCTK